jgi:hypothetical protein
LRARPEQTQLVDLSDASFLGKLLVLPANVRLDWKVIARYKHSSLFGLIISNKEKSFIAVTPDGILNLILNEYTSAVSFCCQLGSMGPRNVLRLLF